MPFLKPLLPHPKRSLPTLLPLLIPLLLFPLLYPLLLAGSSPCEGYMSPSVIEEDNGPPSIFFLHIPKTAGTLLYSLLVKYATRSNGLACNYAFDGNRFPAHHVYLANAPPADATVEEARMLSAMESGDKEGMREEYRKGVCRINRGHVTVSMADGYDRQPLMVTVLRDPVKRVESMWAFVQSMMKDRPGKTGWEKVLTGDSLEMELSNASSVLYQGFYDADGVWRGRDNVGFTFHFWGVLHQLSGMTPRFEGEGDIERFGIANAAEMKEEAKKRICGMHLIGTQENVGDVVNEVLRVTGKWVDWNEREKQSEEHRVNRTPNKEKQQLGKMRRVVERILKEEIEVYEFAKSVVEWRKKETRPS